jgi:hypothetical protein
MNVQRSRAAGAKSVEYPQLNVDHGIDGTRDGPL